MICFYPPCSIHGIKEERTRKIKKQARARRASETPVEDIRYVVNDLCWTETGRMLVVKAAIVQVLSIDSFKAAEIALVNYGNSNGLNPEIWGCTKCNSKVKISKSKFQCTARIILQEDGGTEHKVIMFGEVIQNISGITRQYRIKRLSSCQTCFWCHCYLLTL